MRNKTVYAIIAIFLIQAFSASLAVIPAQNDVDLFFPESSDTSARNNSSGGGNTTGGGNNTGGGNTTGLILAKKGHLNFHLPNFSPTFLGKSGSITPTFVITFSFGPPCSVLRIGLLIRSAIVY